MKFVKYITAVINMLHQKLMQDKAMLAEKLFNVGISFFELNKYQEAMKNFDLAIKYKPNHVKAYYNKEVCLYELGQFQEVIENFDLAIKYNPCMY
ncbi:tetratricopeptide repeat protein with 2 trp repeats [Orientia tsutsugamushi str. Boryong]|uniref:Tetratricopeptide repeat protein with 2 trp repeats n=2 Tax=Orientia tsutsugamushi TaxID=784 RepID=A5CC19_ORITB|nr:tetratricopeptide repeat protein with 2 trp repeats [Orientia tsutsugamushi str. Boryong]